MRTYHEERLDWLKEHITVELDMITHWYDRELVAALIYTDFDGNKTIISKDSILMED
jgi:hypothetical protein